MHFPFSFSSSFSSSLFLYFPDLLPPPSSPLLFLLNFFYKVFNEEQLSDEQRAVLALAMKGANIFLTGPAGMRESFLSFSFFVHHFRSLLLLPFNSFHFLFDIFHSVIITFFAISLGFVEFYFNPKGTGKTFLLQAIINKLQSRGKVVAITASTGIFLPLNFIVGFFCS